MNDKQAPAEFLRNEWIDRFAGWRLIGKDCIKSAYYNRHDDEKPWHGSRVILDPMKDDNNVEDGFRGLGCIVIYDTHNKLILK